MVAHSTSVRGLRVSPRGLAQHVLDATVVFENEERDVIRKVGRYYDVYFVRSSAFADLHRYYVVTWNNDRSSWQCSCSGCKAHAHIHQVNQYIEKYLLKETA